MALIKSISGIRGTIGGIPGTALTPLDIVRFTAAYAQFIRQQSDTERLTIVVGRDARISGAMVNTLVTGTLLAMGVDVIDTGLSTTPTVEVSVINIKADGGIIITASHNPAQWNALKLLNHHGEFLSAADGEEILRLADSDEIHFAEATALGTLIERHDTIQEHIRQVLALDLVDVEAIRKANFKVAVDAVNSTGGIAIPALLEALGVKEIKKIYCDPDGDFPHNPEPLPENLTEIAKVMRQGNYDVGFVVDPDVDRLAIICENGEMFGEEYTLVAVADYVLSHTPGNTVSNLSSSRALRDVTVAAGGSYQASAVGEVNVVELMKKTNAVIGGEGNGGIIYPAAHYGRDALVGIALFLTFMAKEKATPTEIRKRYPAYFISKNKIQLSPALDVDDILKKVADSYRHERVTTIDGVKVDFDKEWVHLRKSNTEPIIRIYAESTSAEKATALAKSVIDKIKSIAGI
ncbi:MAG: phosphoglucosamine mutase [Bacteroidales bacterium]|jgi:phosphomannomutase|nr:phosphoglucosamine mutase [Bacteroidales bacterium]MDD4178050.1 phosphoglucosamine mutase [Bacteroidales bacterium]MDD4742408.1 phosphoglucosamine mutase [Bacteroidales bacterium]MDY0335562.1 phosphoglucosamine mutase [Bacteroidales bacterium]